ncbi:oligosaccharide flippase family protein [Halomonas cupida]|uniref:oligosaccharide flippase family protein n=1 Tax=Halomonas cupida TaxID=44933 RepID=UPI003EF7217C
MKKKPGKRLVRSRSEKNLVSVLLVGGAGGVGVKIVNVMLQVGSSVVVARCLGPSLLGVYTLLMSAVQVSSVFFQLGMPSYLVRYISAQRAVENNIKPSEVVVSSLLVSFTATLICTIIAVCVYFLLFFFTDHLNTVSFNLILMMSLMTCLYALITIISGADRGYGNVVKSQVPVQIVRPFIFLIIISFFASGIEVDSVNPILFVNFLSVLLAFFVSLYFLARNREFSWNSPCRLDFRKYIKLGFPFLLLSGTQVFSQHIDILMLGAMAEDSSVGAYKVSAQLTDILVMPLLAVSLAIGPVVARLQSVGKVDVIGELVGACHQVAFVCLVPAAIVIAIYAEMVLTFVYGDSFAGASHSLVVFAIGKLLYSTVCFSGIVLSMIGKPNVASAIAAGTLVFNGVLNFILIPQLGSAGAAIATCVSQVVVNSIGCCWMLKVIGVNVSAFRKVFSLKKLRSEII